MTGPDKSSGRIGYAMLANGAPFSVAVLQALREQGLPPRVLVLPEYAPARQSPADIHGVAPTSSLLQLASNIELVYVPRQRQAQGAEKLRQRGIDYLLVACWPYLIGEELRLSARVAALNLHPSLLPKYAGANPLERQIASRDTRGGITLHLLDDKFDHGDIVAQAEIGVAGNELERESLESRCAI